MASGSQPTCWTRSPLQGTAGAEGEAKLLAPVARLYLFLDSIAGGFRLEPVLGAPEAGEGRGRGSVAARGAVHGGSLYCSLRLQLSCQERVRGGPSRPNACPVPAVPMLRHLGAPAWDPPRKAEPAQGERKILASTTSSGREAPSHRGVCAASRGEARRKSRERSRFWARWQESSAGGRSGS